MKRRMTLSVLLVFTAAALLLWVAGADAFPTWFNAAPTPNPATGQCTNCHISQNLTANNYCGMCHAHGTHPNSTKSTINVTATADKASYAPGEAMVVTLSGGYRPSTARAVVFDGPNPTTAVQKAISTGTLDPAGGAPINAPAWTGSAPATIVLSGFTAPTVAGTYTWYGAWYGNDYDLGIIGGTTTFGLWTADPGNPGHGWEMAAFTFTVVAPNPCAGFVSTPCTVTGQFGPCANSNTVCDPTTGATTCPQTVFPTLEVCTGGIDENCNNLIDCNDTAACATDPACIPPCTGFVPSACSVPGQVGPCAASLTACDPTTGAITCPQTVFPTPEVCTGGIDENCNNLMDCNDTAACASDPACVVNLCTGFVPAACTVTGQFGPCASSTTVCDPATGVISCPQTVFPTPEVCTGGIDENCNGAADCADTAACASDPTCVVNPCAGFVPSACSVPGQVGPCAASLTACDPTTGAITCPQTVFPTPEVCTGGIDENCNNLMDCNDTAACASDPACVVNPCAGFVPAACTVPGQFGPCASSTSVCDPATGVITCPQTVFPTPEVCTGSIDEDCNSLIDCADTAACASDPACVVNLCAGFAPATCTVPGQFGPCSVSTTVCDPATGEVSCPQTVFPAPAEICTDGIDNDCDGLIDAADRDCQVGDVGLKKLIVPNHMTMKVGGRERDRLINVQARVFNFDEDVMAMVTLMAVPGAGVSVEIDPSSITKEMNEHGVTVFHFRADIACTQEGSWAINWTATIAGEQNTDPANDTLTDVTQVRCQNQGNSGNGNAGNKSKDPKASNGNNAADTGKDNNAANGGGNGSSDNNAGGNSIANANAGGNANSNANVNAGGNGNGNNKDKDKDKSKNK